MASSARIDELKKKFDENPRRYFAPLANEFRKGGDLDQAILICQTYLPEQPGHMSGHIVYGQALYEQGNLEESRTVFETALGLDPENLIALRHLGDIADRSGDPTSARRWYERVLEADPRNDEIQGLIAGLGASRASDEGGSQSWEAAQQQPAGASSYDSVETQTQHHVEPVDFEPTHVDLDLTVPEGVPVVSGPPAASRAAFDGYGSIADARANETPFDAISLEGIEPTPETAELMPAVPAHAEGFEATEFSAPVAPVEQTAGLQSAFEDETGIHGAAIAPLPGLDRPEIADEPRTHEVQALDLPDLNEDRGLVVPPHGDPTVETAVAPAYSGGDLPTLDDDLGVVGHYPDARHETSGYASQAEAARSAPEPLALESEFDMPGESSGESAGRVPDAAPAGSALPVELPPEVIAAEADLIEGGFTLDQTGAEESAEEEALETDSVGGELSFIDTESESEADASSSQPAYDAASEPEPADEPEPASAAPQGFPELDDEYGAAPVQRPFVTETMAELYLKQGFRDQALTVYEQLSDANPSDARLADKVAELRAAALVSAPAANGSSVRDFFARLAAKRPGERAASYAPPADNDFAGDGAQPDPIAETAPAAYDAPEPPAAAPVAAAASPMPSAVERAATTRGGGTIDALFGNRPIGTSEDSAASALAQAFGSTEEAPAITGNPARQASGELSLDSVFRDGASRGPRASQGFSFDQFFSQNAEGERTSGGPRNSQEIPAPGEPAEKSADDIEQFNSWLQGLKQR